MSNRVVTYARRWVLPSLRVSITCLRLGCSLARIAVDACGMIALLFLTLLWLPSEGNAQMEILKDLVYRVWGPLIVPVFGILVAMIWLPAHIQQGYFTTTFWKARWDDPQAQEDSI